MKILIIDARYYEKIAEEMLQGAVEVLEKAKVKYDVVTVPGAFEVPAAISFALKKNKYDGYIALGCVIRGETSHYDYVCQESARGINDLAMKKHAAIGYGILTVENEAQAWDRAKRRKQNKGGFAAKACLDMINLKKKLKA